MTHTPKKSSLDRREFLAATGGLLASAVPGGGSLAKAARVDA